MTFDELIDRAKEVCGLRKLNEDVEVGGVAAAVLSESGRVYTGVCIDMPCGLGFCAERAALAAMITAGESKIRRVVAINEGKPVPPCGSCREFMNLLDADNLDAEVMVRPDTVVKLVDLLPHRWDED